MASDACPSASSADSTAAASSSSSSSSSSGHRRHHHNKVLGRYITNSGAVMQFDLSACSAVFGVPCGSRICNAKTNKCGVVVGVHNSRLWIHVDGEKGASMVPYKNKRHLRKGGWAPVSSSSVAPHEAGHAALLSTESFTRSASPPSASSETNGDHTPSDVVIFVVEGKKITANRQKMLGNFYFRFQA